MTRLVYSTGPGRSDDPAPRRSLPASDHDIRVRRERAGRRGKTVTVAGPFRLTAADARALSGRLKRACGSGGTAKPSTAGEGWVDLEIQGDHVERAIAELSGLGYPVKRSGGQG